MFATMVFDLRRALLKKEEIESARLMDFEFRLRARTMRLLATELGLDPEEVVTRIAVQGDDGILAELAGTCRLTAETLDTLYRNCREIGRKQLVVERGDPTPHKIA